MLASPLMSNNRGLAFKGNPRFGEIRERGGGGVGGRYKDVKYQNDISLLLVAITTYFY